jgi:hypothetical protein
MRLGRSLGFHDRISLGDTDGTDEILREGVTEGSIDGDAEVGLSVALGLLEVDADGPELGSPDPLGDAEGELEGPVDGSDEGSREGALLVLGWLEGIALGLLEGGDEGQ